MDIQRNRRRVRMPEQELVVFFEHLRTLEFFEIGQLLLNLAGGGSHQAGCERNGTRPAIRQGTRRQRYRRTNPV